MKIQLFIHPKLTASLRVLNIHDPNAIKELDVQKAAEETSGSKNHQLSVLWLDRRQV
jgi:hypothetical protein